MDRTRGIGALSAEEAIDYGITGPVLRASGVEYDVRKAHPYSGYESFDFDVPVGKNGDVYDRYLVRLEEMQQSCKILRQALDNLPDGPVNVEDLKVALPEKEQVYTQMEPLVHHFKFYIDGPPMPVGEVYQAIEAPKGELGYYIISKGDKSAHRLRIRPPSFLNLSALSKMVEGMLVADLVAVVGSLDIVLGEIDR
jgi:NADH-quinone oxidoreductase subunit D